MGDEKGLEEIRFYGFFFLGVGGGFYSVDFVG